MEMKGYILEVLEARGGTSARTGNSWKIQSYVLETLEQYPRHLMFDVRNDNIEKFDIKVGEEMVVSFDVDANKYQERWYNKIVAWKVEKTGRFISQNTPQPITPSVTAASNANPADPFGGEPIEPFGY